MQHYASFVKFEQQDLAFGDSLHLGPATDILAILRWVLEGLPSHEIGPNTTFQPGTIDRQSALAGGGSCGISATNFAELRADIGHPWRAKQSEAFRDEFLRDLLLYPLIAKRKTSSYAEWVTPCTRMSIGEQAGFYPAAVGYNDFNLYMPAASLSTKSEWTAFVKLTRAQPMITLTNTPKPSPSKTRATGVFVSAPGGLAPAFELQPPAVPPISKLAAINLVDAPANHFQFDLSGYGTSTSAPQTPPRKIKPEAEVIDLCTPSTPAMISLLDPSTPSQLAKEEIIDLSLLGNVMQALLILGSGLWAEW
ncbi:hypothetical protein K438DRAFT_1777471 [Mycena galopus ATCC 62051]|nr:hypothetical protein K438DRAFT_1777471 [Mycena galopus ATCC 62051]